MSRGLVAAVAVLLVGAAPPFDGLKPQRSFRKAPWTAEMNQTVQEVLSVFPGELYLYVSDPWRAHRFDYRSDELAYLASGVKVAFMVELFRQAARGELSFDEELEYTEADIRDGAPRINKLKRGTRLPITTLIEWMVRTSDNGASDMLAKRVGLAEVNEGLEAEGITGFARITFLLDVRRGIYRELTVTADDLTPEQVRSIRWTPIWDPQIRKLELLTGLPPNSIQKSQMLAAYERFYNTKVNAAPMASMGHLLEKMCSGQLVSPKASAEMLHLMRGVRTSSHRIMGKLPQGTKVAHKTGSQFRRVCDMGVITMPDGHPVVVSACTETEDVRAAEDAIATLARKAYDLVHEQP